MPLLKRQRPATTNATGPSWCRRTPRLSSGTSTTDTPLHLAGDRPPVFAGNFDHRDLMHPRLAGRPRDPSWTICPCSPPFLKDSRIQRYTEMTARFRKRGTACNIWCKVWPSPACTTTGAIQTQYRHAQRTSNSATRSVLGAPSTAGRVRSPDRSVTTCTPSNFAGGQQAVHAYPSAVYSIRPPWT